MMVGSPTNSRMYAFAASGIKGVAHAIGYLLLARALGADGFGTVASVLALATLCTPFAELGLYQLSLLAFRHGTEPGWNSVARYLSRTPATSGLAVAIYAASALLLRIDVSMLIYVGIGLGALVLTRPLKPAEAVAVATGRFAALFALHSMWSIAFILAAALVATLSPTAGAWAIAYVLYCSYVGLTGLLYVTASARRLGRPLHLDTYEMFRASALWIGMPYAVGAAAQNAQYDLDKALLARLDALDSAGLYTAAAKLVAAAQLPILAYLVASHRRLYVEGEAQAADSTRLRDLRIGAIVVSLGLATLVYTSGPYAITRLLGDEFAASAEIVRWLAPVLVLQASYLFSGDVVTSLGAQWLRTRILLLGAGANLGLNIVLIPLYSWRGAVYATLASEAVVTALMFMSERFRRKRTNRSVPGA